MQTAWKQSMVRLGSEHEHEHEASRRRASSVVCHGHGVLHDCRTTREGCPWGVYRPKPCLRNSTGTDVVRTEGGGGGGRDQSTGVIPAVALWCGVWRLGRGGNRRVFEKREVGCQRNQGAWGHRTPCDALFFLSFSNLEHPAAKSPCARLRLVYTVCYAAKLGGIQSATVTSPICGPEGSFQLYTHAKRSLEMHRRRHDV